MTLHAAQAEAVIHQSGQTLPQPARRLNNQFDPGTPNPYNVQSAFLLLLSCGSPVRLACRVQFSVVGYVGGRHGHARSNVRIGGFIVQISQDLLKTEVGRFLEHQLVPFENTGVDLQDNKPDAFVLVLNPEAVLTVPGLGNHPKISQLMQRVLCHELIPDSGIERISPAPVYTERRHTSQKHMKRDAIKSSGSGSFRRGQFASIRFHQSIFGNQQQAPDRKNLELVMKKCPECSKVNRHTVISQRSLGCSREVSEVSGWDF